MNEVQEPVYASVNVMLGSVLFAFTSPNVYCNLNSLKSSALSSSI